MNTGIKRLNLDTPKNLRDLGGLMRKDGKVTKYREFLRGDAMHNLTEKDMDFLKDYGLKTIIDLRTDDEFAKEPNDYLDMEGYNYVRIPLFNDVEVTFDSNDFTLGDLYIYLLDHCPNFGNLFNYMAEHNDGIILYHCTAGKDRTGVTSAILFMLAGVDFYDIIADYEVSSTYFRQTFQKQLEINPDIPMHFSHSRSEWIEQFMDKMTEKFGSCEKFLLSKGVTKENIDILVNKLI